MVQRYFPSVAAVTTANAAEPGLGAQREEGWYVDYVAWNGHAGSILNGAAHYRPNSLGGHEERAWSTPYHKGEIATHDMKVPLILHLTYATMYWRRICEMDI
jgi:hypothetical protein